MFAFNLTFAIIGVRDHIYPDATEYCVHLELTRDLGAGSAFNLTATSVTICTEAAAGSL